MDFSLDYSKLIHLDAEELAEAGIHRAYEELLPSLRQFIARPDRIVEVVDNFRPSYSVIHRAAEYFIYGPEVDELGYLSWGNATFAFFSIVNSQLTDVPCRFYAINGGNDLGGMFLTIAEFDAARKSLRRKSDWPYLPTELPPGFGQLFDNDD